MRGESAGKNRGKKKKKKRGRETKKKNQKKPQPRMASTVYKDEQARQVMNGIPSPVRMRRCIRFDACVLAPKFYFANVE